MLPVVQIPFDRPTFNFLVWGGNSPSTNQGGCSLPPLSFEAIHGRELFEESLSFKMRLVTVTGKNVQPGALSPPGLAAAATASKPEE